MAIFVGCSYYSDSPVLTIAPQTAHQAIVLNSPSYDVSSLGPSMATVPQHPSLPKLKVAGTKRSRDEADENLCDDPPTPTTPTTSESMKDADNDWIFGEGMILMKPEHDTMAEDKSEAASAVRPRSIYERPSMRNFKAQRLNSKPAPATTLSGSSPVPALSHDGSAGPVVDLFTLHLGIGWRRISEDEHIQAAARGWARFIENHFPLSDVTIRLESKGLQSYLVESAQGYFLFDENLRQGRLVSTSDAGVLQNLKSNPPTFEGAETMTATETPRAAENREVQFAVSQPSMATNDTEMVL